MFSKYYKHCSLILFKVRFCWGGTNCQLHSAWEKTSAYYTQYQSWNPNTQNPLKTRFVCMTIFLFSSWPFFWKSTYNIVQYGRIVPTEASKPEHHRLIPITPALPRELPPCMKEWQPLGCCLKTTHLSCTSCPFIFLLIPGKMKLQTGCVFHGHRQVYRGTKALWDSTYWEFLV